MENRIKELRSLQKLTQEDLAKECGVSRQTIISLERGKYDPSIHLAHRIGVIFGLAIEEIFIFTEEE